MLGIKLLWISLVFHTAGALYISDHLRFKRQQSDQSGPSRTRRPRPYELPAGYKPYPGTNMSESLTPTFPFAHTYSNGLDVNPGNIRFTEANLNVPIPGWGIWDLYGRQISGPQTTWMNYGHLVQPANMFGLSPSQVNDMISSPGYQAAREQAQPQPVVQLPGGFVPANCTPPMCNPFISQIASGAQFLPGQKNRQFDGLIDFPVPTGPEGRNVRFPLGGNFVAGRSPFMYTHGQVLNPVNPFPGYKPNPNSASASNSEGSSLLEQTYQKSSLTNGASGRSVGNSEPVDLPPLPPGYTEGRRTRRDLWYFVKKL